MIYYTITRETYGLLIYTKDERAKPNKVAISIPAIALFRVMDEITEEYNKDGIGVLFEVE